MFLCVFVAKINVGKVCICLIHDTLHAVDYIGAIEGVSRVEGIKAPR